MSRSFTRMLLQCAIVITALFTTAVDAFAGPCGMVMPIPASRVGKVATLKRYGIQRTYVFYKDGIESIVIRPGFEGKVSNFGILIPFPTAPTMRKVPDKIFSQIAAVINPPEVVVHSRRRSRGRRSLSLKRRPGAADSVTSTQRLALQTVKVLHKEAVGMYQMAVLAAGSAKALQGWMTRNRFRYPKGMDQVVQDYIRARWVFVAVKARVANAKPLAPRPGMRKTAQVFPKGGSFSGHVQAMGFRFRTNKLVLPMRLAAYNAGFRGGTLHNAMYILTQGPKAIKELPKRFVVRQIKGHELHDNVTKHLPIRVFGAHIKYVNSYRWPRIQRMRQPDPHMGQAKHLFASDLLAAKQNILALSHEETIKEISRINEALFLRSSAVDRYTRQVVSGQRKKTLSLGLDDLKKMTLTVIDGDFPRHILARQNLTITPYTMPARYNHVDFYEAQSSKKRTKRPKKPGKYYRHYTPKLRKRRRSRRRVAQRNKRKPRRKHTNKHIQSLIAQFSDPTQVTSALAALQRIGERAMPLLFQEAQYGGNLIRRGWSIVALSRTRRSKKVPRFLIPGGQRRDLGHLDRVWMYAASILQAQTRRDLQRVSSGLTYLARTQHGPLFRALRRPVEMRLFAIMGPSPRLPTLLSLSAARQFREIVAPLISRQSSAKQLLHQAFRGRALRIRQRAALYYSGRAARLGTRLHANVAKKLRWYKRARRVPWHGGSLVIPVIKGYWHIFGKRPQKRRRPRMRSSHRRRFIARPVRAWRRQKQTWRRTYAIQTTDALIRWLIWSTEHKKTREVHRILSALTKSNAVLPLPLRYNSLYGYQKHRSTLWLNAWRVVIGDVAFVALLRELGVAQKKQYQLKRIKAMHVRFSFARGRPNANMGCFRDSRSRDLSVQVKGNRHNKHSCIKECTRRYYAYAGVQNGGDCYCGNSFGRYGMVTYRGCRRRCRAFPRAYCGGVWRNQIYRTTIVRSIPPPPHNPGKR